MDDVRRLFPSKEQVISTQLVVALLMTEALPRIKRMKDADRQLRILFQRLSSLSATAQSLSSKFQYEPLILHDDQRRAMETAMIDQGFTRSDIEIEKSKRPQHVWTRICLLWCGFQRWEETAAYAVFLNANESEVERLKTEQVRLANKAKHCFKLASAAEEDRELYRVLSDCTDHYTVQFKQHLQKLADFMSRGLLATRKGDARPVEIAGMGFRAELNQGVSPDHLTLMFVMLFTISVVFFSF